MKRLATILLVLITFSCSSQTINYLPYYKFKYKLGAGRLEVDSSATIPNDTTYSAPNNSIAIKGDSLYVKTSNRWRGVASVSSGPGGVTSVGATASGALSVTGSPVTSSGTLAFGWTGAASEYVKGNGVASNFSADVKTVGDARYAYKLHTHLFDHITNGVSAVRNLFSVGAGLSYNPATGVFSALDTLDPANYALITQLNDSMTTVRDSLTAIAARIGAGGGGSTPTLQDVTGAGNTTSYDIQANALRVAQGSTGIFFNVGMDGTLINPGYGYNISGTSGKLFFQASASSGAPGSAPGWASFLSLAGNGQMRNTGYGNGTRTTGTPRYALAVDSVGNFIETTLATGSSLPYKEYTAILNQSGTAAPTATVVYNDLGGTVTWARVGAGTYTATLTGVFTNNKTVGFITASVSYAAQLAVRRLDNDSVEVKTAFGGSPSDDALNGNSFTIRVYN